MKKAAGLFRSLMRTSIKSARQGVAVNKLMTAMLTPTVKPAPPRRKVRAKPAASLAKPVRSTARPAPAPSSITTAPGKWLTSHVEGANGHRIGQRMRYWLYLPNNRPEKGMPLVVMLHGCQQTATQFAQGTRMNLHAEKMGCAVLYPQQLISSHPHRCWKWYERATQDGGGDVPPIIGIIHKVLTQYDIDRSRIYVAGISAGAGMANILALNHPRLFAAIGLHSGPVFGAGHSALGALSVMKNGALGMGADLAAHAILQRHPQFPGMPAILFQGESDNVVKSINQIQLTRQSLLLNRLSGPAKSTEKRHYWLLDYYDGRKLLLRVAQVEKLEHAWSGGDPSLQFNDRAGPNASKMMLEFFARHRRA